MLLPYNPGEDNETIVDDERREMHLGVHMVTFVREAIGRVRRVYERLVALATTAEPANGNAAAAEANADRNAAAADAA